MHSAVKIGLVIDKWEVEEWKYRLVKILLGLDYAEIVYIKILDVAAPKRGFISFHRYIDKSIFQPTFDALKLRNVSLLVKNAQLQPGDPDVIIYLGNETLCETTFYQVKYGLWTLRFFNLNSQPYEAPGYLEVMNEDEFSISALHVRSVRYPNGKTVKQSFSRINYNSISLTQEMIYARSLSLIPSYLRQVSNSKEITMDHPENEDLEVKTVPNTFHVIHNSLNHFIRLMKEFMKLKSSMGQWFLLYHVKGVKSGIKISGDFYQVLYPKEGFYWADPFVIVRDDKHYIFYEEVPYTSNRGHISCMLIDLSTGFKLKYDEVLKRPYHLSYPFLFEFEHSLYMIPESCENRNIELYQCESFPNRWRFVANIMEDINAVDTTLFYHNNCWWMFTSISTHEGAIHDDELHIFYSENPIATNWVAHPSNPVVTDVRKARMAGNIFIRDSKIIRPGQDCSGRYGKSIVFNEILKLNKIEYMECVIEVLKADWDSDVFKTHTYNSKGSITVIDAFRRIPK